MECHHESVDVERIGYIPTGLRCPGCDASWVIQPRNIKEIITRTPRPHPANPDIPDDEVEAFMQAMDEQRCKCGAHGYQSTTQNS